MDEETRDHKQRLLEVYQDNLRELEIQEAYFGVKVPLDIFNNIKYHRKNIDDLRLQLNTNAEEVSFDKLLVGIEDLRKTTKQEGMRAIKEFQRLFEDTTQQAMRVLYMIAGAYVIIVILWVIYRSFGGEVAIVLPEWAIWLVNNLGTPLIIFLIWTGLSLCRMHLCRTDCSYMRLLQFVHKIL